MSLMRLTGVRNILIDDPELANNEVLLGAKFLKLFGYSFDLNIDEACSKCNNLEELMLLYDKHYDVNLIRKLIEDFNKNDRNLLTK